MASEPDGERTPHNLSEDGFRGVQKLVSKLQKAVTKGRTSESTLKEADRYIGRLLTSQIGQTLQYLDDVTAKAGRLETKEMFGKLYLRLMGSFKSLKAMEGKAYSEFAGSKSSLDVNALSDLIDIDSELATILFRMSSWLSKHRNLPVTAESDVTLLSEMVDLLQDNVKRRENLVQKNKR
jgi:hypothetical protein